MSVWATFRAFFLRRPAAVLVDDLIKPPVVRFEKLSPAAYDQQLADQAKRRQTVDKLRRESARIASGQCRRSVVLPMREVSRD